MVATREGWHWLAADRRLAHEPYTEVVVGQTVRVKGKLIICENAVHGSERALDALQYAPGPVIARCMYKGPFVTQQDKFGARRRTPLWIADASTVLHEFACWCAEADALRTGADGGYVMDDDERFYRMQGVALIMLLCIAFVAAVFWGANALVTAVFGGVK